MWFGTWSGWSGRLSGRPVVALVIAAAGYGLNYWAWTLVGPLGPELADRFGLGASSWVLLGVVAALVGSLARIPAGVLADQFGARLVLPAVSAGAAVVALGLAAADSVPALVGVAVAAGVAGAAFPAGVGLVGRAFPPGQRGFALSVYGAGMGLAAAAGIASRPALSVDRHDKLLLLATALLAYAAFTWTFVRDTPDETLRRTRGRRIALAVLRMPAVRHLSAWYAVSCGGMVAFDLYLPSYLHHAYGVSWGQATIYAATGVGVTAASHPAGGWWCRRRDPVRLLSTCYAATAALLLVLAFRPPLAQVAVPAMLAVAVLLGTASGVVLGHTGSTAPADQIATIAGVIGAVAGVAGLLPPLLLAAVYGLQGSYGIALTLLAGGALAAAAYLYTRRSWIGAAAVFPTAVVPYQTDIAGQTATTVVALSARQTGARTGDVVAALATLATRHELAIVYAHADTSRGRHGGYPLIAGLRRHLPRHTIIAIATAAPPHPHEAQAIAEMLDIGAVAVAFVPTVNPDPSAILLAGRIGADQVLHLAPDRVEGFILRPGRPSGTGIGR